MSIKKLAKEYLVFNKRERIALVALLGPAVAFFLFPLFFSTPAEPLPIKERLVLTQTFDSLESRQNSTAGKRPDTAIAFYQYEPSEAKNYTSGTLFPFDPNTLSVEGWQKLGLSKRTAHTISNYRSKGGRFYKPEDLKKIWGLPEGFYERVKNHIVLAPVEKSSPHYEAEKPVSFKTEKRTYAVHVNQADTLAFIALPGIGSRLAARIVNFREKLGGFYAIEQIAETYGLPDSTFQKIKPYLLLSGSVKKFNINTATKEELKLHPYFKWALAHAIVEYRNQHGSFKSLEELKNIVSIDEAAFHRIVAYLEL